MQDGADRRSTGGSLDPARLGESAVEGYCEVLEIEPDRRSPRPGGFVWRPCSVEQELWAVPRMSGRPASGQRVVARCRLDVDPQRARTAIARLDALNRRSLLAAWIEDPEAAGLALVSTTWLEAESSRWRELWWILAATLQLVQAEHMAAELGDPIEAAGARNARAARNNPSLALAGDILAAGRSQACPLRAADFSAAAFQEPGDWLLPSADERGLGALIPLDPQMPASEFMQAARETGGETPAAVLRLDATARHPEVGSGLAVLLRLPSGLAGDASVARAARLNRAELEQPGAASQLGAWLSDARGLVWSAFLPSLLWLEMEPTDRRPALHGLLTDLARRTVWAAAQLES